MQSVLLQGLVFAMLLCRLSKLAALFGHCATLGHFFIFFYCASRLCHLLEFFYSASFDQVLNVVQINSCNER